MGSMLVGPAAEIARARRARKIFGGALRQAGIVAAAALYALEHHIERLADDHVHARLFALRLAEIDGIHIQPDEVETNLVFFEVDPKFGTSAQLSTALRQSGVRINPAGGPQRLRACMHLDVTRDDVLRAVEAVRTCMTGGFSQVAAAADSPYGRG